MGMLGRRSRDEQEMNRDEMRFESWLTDHDLGYNGGICFYEWLR